MYCIQCMYIKMLRCKRMKQKEKRRRGEQDADVGRSARRVR
jgi:hypothetical protein